MLKFLQLLMRMLLESYIDGGTLCGSYEVYIYIYIYMDFTNVCPKGT